MAGRVIAEQLGRSGTAVGGNVEEAQGAHSRNEFIRQMNIARSEAREPLHWLRLVAEPRMLARDQLSEITTETDELVRTLTTIVKRARAQR